jgi:hypothetical protein
VALASPSTVLLAGLIDSPAIYRAAVTHELPATSALYRFLIAVPVAAVMLGVLRSITANYGQQKDPDAPIRARSERLDADETAGPRAPGAPPAQPQPQPQGQPTASPGPPPQNALPG